MEPYETSTAALPSAALSAVGLDHARLCYAYLNSGDMDGYASLFSADALVRRPGEAPVRGRGALERGDRRPGRYIIRNAFSSADWVATTGTFVRDDDRESRNVEFADIFTVGDSGLLVTQSTYYFAPYS